MNNFAVLTIAQSRMIGGIEVIITTNNPCHLTCYWTGKKPLKHHDTRLVRGIEVPWGTYFCFVSWHAVEQNEPGDTLTHTFDLIDWLYCQTRWITFRGTVADVLSPSVGPIFQKHNSFFPLIKYEYYDAAWNTGLYTSATVKLGQTFTSPSSHNIAQVVLLMRRDGWPGIMNLEIQGTDLLGFPNGVIHTSGTFNGNALPPGAPPSAIWITIPFTPCELDSFTTYAIVVYGGDDTNKVGWNAQSGNPYPSGKLCYWTPPPFGWTAILDWDFLFEEWGYPT